MIYLLEDDDSIRKLVLYGLDSQGFQAKGFALPSEFWRAMDTELPELVLLDIMLPEEDGLSILKKLRARPATKRLPIIMLTAKDSEYDYVQGITIGSDDYLTKPFRPTTLLMRVRSLLRRMEMNSRRPVQPEEPDDLVVGDLTFSAEANTISCNGKGIGFTQTELRMLSYMMQKPGKAYARDKLLETIWGYETEVETRVTDETLRRIRRKLSLAGSSVCVQTIWGYGYKLEVSEPVK